MSATPVEARDAIDPAIREVVRASRAAQGLDPDRLDPAVIDRLVALTCAGPS